LQDPGAPSGRYQYWKTASYSSLTSATVDLLAAALQDLPTRQTEIHVQHLGGALARVPAGDTAFALREAQFFVNLIGATPWIDEFVPLRERVRQLYAQIAPHALGAMLPNFSNQDDGDVTTSPDSSNAERISTLRRRYDPSGAFAVQATI
jgi:hypothetical protein